MKLAGLARALLASLALTLATGPVHGRGVTVDDGLDPSLIRFGLESFALDCSGSACVGTLPYEVDLGNGFTSQLHAP